MPEVPSVSQDTSISIQGQEEARSVRGWARLLGVSRKVAARIVKEKNFKLDSGQRGKHGPTRTVLTEQQVREVVELSRINGWTQEQAASHLVSGVQNYKNYLTEFNLKHPYVPRGPKPEVTNEQPRLRVKRRAKITSKPEERPLGAPVVYERWRQRRISDTFSNRRK